MLVSHVLARLAFLSTTSALPTSLIKEPVLFSPAVSSSAEMPSALSASSPISLLYQFNETAKLENLAARSNGHLLLTSTDQAHVYSYDPRRNVTSLLHKFPKSSSTLGIVEAAPDVFIVAVGNYSAGPGEISVPGTFSVWSMDLNNNPEKPTVNKITAIPEAEALNGMTTIKGSSDLVLIADSWLGAIWRVNITSGSYSKAMEHVLFTNSTSVSLGINGIQTCDETIYFVNSAQRLYGRIPINKTGGATAEPEIIALTLPAVDAWDDFAVDCKGNAWITSHPNAVTQVTLGGRQRNFTVDDPKSDIQQPTALVFGRGSRDAEKTLFVVTAGGTNPEKKQIPGQILAFDTRLIWKEDRM